MTQFEKSVVDFCEANGLTAVSFNYNYSGDGSWSAYAHRAGDCASGLNGSLPGALGDAIAELNAKPADIACDEPLPELAA